jgi:hypothetical protein
MKLTDEEIKEIITSTVVGPVIDMDDTIQFIREIMDEWSDDLKVYLVTLAGDDRRFLVALAETVIAMCLHAEDSMVDRASVGGEWYRVAYSVEQFKPGIIKGLWGISGSAHFRWLLNGVFAGSVRNETNPLDRIFNNPVYPFIGNC